MQQFKIKIVLFVLLLGFSPFVNSITVDSGVVLISSDMSVTFDSSANLSNLEIGSDYFSFTNLFYTYENVLRGCSINYSTSNSNVLITHFCISPVSSSETSSSETNRGSSNYRIGTFKPTQENLKNGYSVNLATNQKVVISSDRTATINSVSESEVGFSLAGEDYLVADGETLKIDTNSDGVYDLAITNNGVIGSYANLEFILIHEEVPSETQQDESGNVIDTGEKIGFWKSIGNFFSRLWDWITFWN